MCLQRWKGRPGVLLTIQLEILVKCRLADTGREPCKSKAIRETPEGENTVDEDVEWSNLGHFRARTKKFTEDRMRYCRPEEF